MTIQVGNKLKITAKNWVTIPGCEPLSMMTSNTLSRRYAGACNFAYADVKKALIAIPDAYIERWHNGDLFFVLPNFKKTGCRDCESPIDYYAVLRSIAEEPGDAVKNFQEVDYGNIVERLAEDYPGICW